MDASEAPIARPCPRTWDEIAGAGPTRLCTHCGSAVTDLSALDEASARAHLAADPAGCVSYVRVGRRIRTAAGLGALAATACASEPGIEQADPHHRHLPLPHAGVEPSPGADEERVAVRVLGGLGRVNDGATGAFGVLPGAPILPVR